VKAREGVFVNGERPIRRRGPGGGSASGVILIVIGLVFLLDRLGVMDAEHFWKFWPVLVVLSGAIRLRDAHGRLYGILLIAFGLLLLGANLRIGQLNWGVIWPIGLILLGIFLIWDRYFARKDLGQMENSHDHFNDVAMFGGVERRVTVQDFRGGTISAIFGGVELDLRGADMAGNETTIDVEAIFGGIELTVPTTWTVVFQGQSIFGGYSDETITQTPSAVQTAPIKTLIIRGRAMFGGVSVKN
jgi:predicted membrane protein